MEVGDENVSASTGRGNVTLSNMKRRRNGLRNDFDQHPKAFGEKFNGKVQQASDTAADGVETSDAEVKHYDADGASIDCLSKSPLTVAHPS